MKIIKKIKKVIISVIMTIMLLPKNIFAMDLTPLYGPPKPEPTFIETIWKTIKTYILPISLFIIFIVGSIIFFKKSKGTAKEKVTILIFILFIIISLIVIAWNYVMIHTN